MSEMTNWEEKQVEAFEADMLGYMGGDESAELLGFIESEMPKGEFQKLLNKWLETKDGVRFYKETVEYLLSDERKPDGPDTVEEARGER